MAHSPGAVSLDGKLSITDAEYERARKVLYDACGVALEGDRRSLVLGRLQQVIRGLNLDNFTAYLDRVEMDRSGRLLSQLVNQISTNYTYFGREWDHFEHFRRKGVPETVERNKRSKVIRVWCAAASTGQEPYTLAGLLADAVGPDYGNWDAGVLATDINNEVLETARQGFFEPEEIKPLDPDLQKRWFQPAPEGKVRVVERLRKDVLYRRFNLTKPAFHWKRPFDLLFCRNVMIYFDLPTKKTLGVRLANSLNRGGYLYIGVAESLDYDSKLLRPVQAGVFQRI